MQTRKDHRAANRGGAVPPRVRLQHKRKHNSNFSGCLSAGDMDLPEKIQNLVAVGPQGAPKLPEQAPAGQSINMN